MFGLSRSARMASSSSRSLTAATRLNTVARHLSSIPPAMSAEAMSARKWVECRTEGLARIYKLNRPEALNALNLTMVEELTKRVQDWRRSDLCQVIIGTGSERAFCSGGDVKRLIQDVMDGRGSKDALSFFQTEFQLNWLLAKVGKPYVSIMDGLTMGGGNGIALPAQIRIATPRTRFAMPETKIGYAPDVGSNYYLAQLDGSIGAWLALTGQEVFGRAVYELGLATHYIAPEAIADVVHEITQLDSPTERRISEIVSSFAPPPPTGSALSGKQTPDAHTAITGEIRQCLDEAFGQDSVQEVYNSLKAFEANEELSEGVRKWAAEQAGIMDLRSPTGMAVALEAYRLAKKSQRLDDVLQHDMSMANIFIGPQRATEDFITGVTAVLIDKSSDRPDWSPSDLFDESLAREKILDTFFDSLSETQVKRPKLKFDPPSRTTNGANLPDSTWGMFRRYGLPSEADVEAVVSGSAPGSGAFKVQTEELVERLLDDRGDAAGPRADEIKKTVRAIVERRCVVRADGYLDLKPE